MPNFRAAILPALALASVFGCSSTPNPVANGGVDIQLQNPAAAVGATCPDRSFELTLFGQDSNKSLLVDGSNNASVKCTVGGSSFKGTVSLSGQTFSVSGSVTQQGGVYVSTNAIVSINLATNSYQTDTSAPCTITFTSYSPGSGGSNSMEAGGSGSIQCGDLLDEASGGFACAINSTFATTDQFKFENCQ
ncbi:MAG: hypothetical protein ACHREM_21250 [Polyangiales bacterium]